MFFVPVVTRLLLCLNRLKPFFLIFLSLAICKILSISFLWGIIHCWPLKFRRFFIVPHLDPWLVNITVLPGFVVGREDVSSSIQPKFVIFHRYTELNMLEPISHSVIDRIFIDCIEISWLCVESFVISFLNVCIARWIIPECIGYEIAGLDWIISIKSLNSNA